MCLCQYGPSLFCFQTNLGRENSASYLKIQAGKTFSHQGQVLVTLYVRFLCSDWSKFDRWVHVKINAASWNLLTLTAEADRVLCQLFNCLFPLDVQNEIWLLSRVLSYSWPVCLLFFCLRDASLVKVGNPISDGIVFVFGLAWCVRGFKKSLKQFWAYLIAFRGLHLEC